MEKRNKKRLTIVIIASIAVFFGILFLYYLVRLGVFSEDTQKVTVLNNNVTFEQPKLSIFDETRYINSFPDTIRVHYPYILVVVPQDTKKITTVYSFEDKKEIASLNDVALDYVNGIFLYNYHGGETYYGRKTLGLHCDQGFIKNDKEILCITAKEADPLENKVISINPQTLEQKDVYSSHNALTAMYYHKNTLYIGEYNFTQNKAFITVNNQTAPIGDLVNIIYPMGDKMYATSFKSSRNKQTESYYEILSMNGKLATKLKGEGLIIFYQSP